MPNNTSTINESTNIGFVLDLAKTDNKKYDLGQIVFVNNEEEKGIYIGQGDNNATQIFSTKGSIAKAATADSLSVGNVGSATQPIYFLNGIPATINFSFSTGTVTDNYKATTLIGQDAIESLINELTAKKIANMPQVFRLKDIYPADKNLGSVDTTVLIPGDVICIGASEYVWHNGGWIQIGNEENYVEKTIRVNAGSGLIGGGPLTSDVTISHPTAFNPASVYESETSTDEETGETTTTVTKITFGSDKEVPVIELDEYGHISAVATQSIYNPLKGYEIASTELAITEASATTIITQNLIIENIDAVSSNIHETINSIKDELQTEINHIGSIDFLGAFDNLPTIGYNETTDTYYITNENEATTDVTNGDIIVMSATSASPGIQYILRIDNSTTHTATSATWEMWGNSNTYVTKDTVKIIGDSGLVGGGTIANENITISHATLYNETSTIGGTKQIISGLNIDEYGHITGFSTTLNKLAEITIATATILAENLDGTSVIFTQSGVQELINDKITKLGIGVLNFRGLKTDLSGIDNPTNGDVIILRNPATPYTNSAIADEYTEYIYVKDPNATTDPGHWESFGDAGTWAYRTIQIIGTSGLTGSGSLESNITIKHATALSTESINNYEITTDQVTGATTTTVTKITFGSNKEVPMIQLDEYGHIVSIATSEINIPSYSGPTWKVTRNYTTCNNADHEYEEAEEWG